MCRRRLRVKTRDLHPCSFTPFELDSDLTRNRSASYNLDDAVQQRINAPPAPPPPPSLAARRHMVHPSDDDGSSDRRAWHWSFFITGLFLLICVGSHFVSERWKPIYDDHAQKTWASGDCLIVDHSDVTRYRTSGESAVSRYYAFLYVQVLPADGFDDDGDARAFKWPHQAKTGKKRYSSFEHEGQAKNFLKRYSIGTTWTCFWDKKHPSKISMKNRCGDWTVVWIGTSMLVFCVLVMVVAITMCTWCARRRRGARETEDTAPTDVELSDR